MHRLIRYIQLLLLILLVQLHLLILGYQEILVVRLHLLLRLRQ